ncbi:MAG: 16S rRNA (uracil(1498)-N(3))-methyltransferase [Candidatus Marinimicrobia bacterium]|nr:16S rRNA (uracil(1498)-N(3))-methyltransferase [Candidatus Neomarinimicrobiota bacterium]
MQLFYSTDIYDGKIELSKTESHHCVKVLRKSIDDVIMVIDGVGNLYTTKLIELNPKKTILEITNVKKEFGKRANYLHIAIAPTKSMDRLEWFMEKVIEIGVDEISLIHCKNSEREKVKLDRCEKIIMSATKQSLKAFLPKLNPIIKFEQFIKTSHFEVAKSIGYLGNEKSVFLSDFHSDKESHLICIGPEGDFSTHEVKMAKDNGFHCISLGKSRLRTETAGVVASTLINL